MLTLTLVAAAAAAEIAPPLPAPVTAPGTALELAMREHALRRRKLDLVGSSVLLGWAVGNVAVGAVGWATAEEPEWVAFHQMSIAWNGINLGLAIPGLVNGLREPRERDLGGLLRAGSNSRLVYGINTGLDVGWILGGALLWQHGEAADDPLFVGFGRSVVVQGGFLLLFDAVMTALHGREQRRFLLRPEVGEVLGVRFEVAL